MKSAFILSLSLILFSCQRESRIISYEEFSPKGIDDLFTNNIHHYKTAITAMRKDKFWNEQVRQFPNDLFNDKKYDFVFFPGFLQGGPFLFLEIRFRSQEECVQFFKEHSKKYVLQFDCIDSLRQSDYCIPSIPDSIMQQYSSFRFFDSVICHSNGDVELWGGIYSGIFLSEKRKSVYCFAEDGRL